MYDADKPELMTVAEREAVDQEYRRRLAVALKPENEQAAMHAAVNVLIAVGGMIKELDGHQIGGLADFIDNALVLKPSLRKHTGALAAIKTLREIVAHFQDEIDPLLENCRKYFVPIAEHECWCRNCCIKRFAEQSGDSLTE